MVYEYIQTLQVSATFPANAAAGTVVNADILVDPTTGTKQNIVTIPQTQQWEVLDIFTRASGDVGVEAQASIIKNGIKTLLITDPLSSLLVSNPSRPTYPKLRFEPGSRLQIKETNLAAVGTSAVTNIFYIKVKVTDFSM